MRRGNCGTGPLSPNLAQVEIVDGVVHITASTWLRGEAVGDVGGTWAACPVAEGIKLRWLVDIYARHKSGVQSVVEAFGNPTVGLLDAMTTLQSAEAAIEKAEREADERRRKLKGRS